MMRLPATVLFLFAGAAVADDAAAKKLLKDLEGSYTATAMTRAGQTASADELKAIAEVTIKGETLTVRFEKEKKTENNSAALVVDPSQKPIAIDMTPNAGPQAGKPVLGILKVEKEMITFCWSDRKDGTERPKEFNSTKENRNLLIVLKREK